MKKQLLRGFGLFGVALFASLFLLTFSDPQSVEKSARGFLEWKLKSDMHEKIDSLKFPQSKTLEMFLGDRAKTLYQETDAKLTVLKQELKDDLPAIMAAVMARMADLNCECRKKWEERIRASLELEIASLEKAKENLADFAQARYMQIVEKLTRDLRTFLGINALVFLLLFLVSFSKPRATDHLFLPGLLMFLSTGICSYFYLFEQNWFYTILYSDYTGFGYLAYLLAVFALLCDIVFNKARVTSEIINALANALGSAFSVAPC